AAAKDEDGAALAEMTCTPMLEEAAEQQGMSEKEIESALVEELAPLAGAEFDDKAQPGSEPGTMEVEYFTSDADKSDDDLTFVVFAEEDGEWHYCGSGGGNSGGEGANGQGGDGGEDG